eukprot:TRINITY_DN258_c0_g2_i4.p1 TRINITY_DN258_c0_g2~~TRINITY_DN258_c0_g2_i4.p1  ORF type:complete len:248 (+),score=37.09 TRINITY_DN258_c0_g2_i4:499-1242(+)
MRVYQKALSKLNELRMEEAKAFKQSMDEHDITTTAIEESKRYFVQIRGEISFLQTRQNILAQVSSHFNNARNLAKSQGNKALFKILGQITSKAQFDNAEIVAKILELCDRVLENVNESRMAEQEEENEKIKMYQAKKKILDDNIFNTQKKIDTLESQKHAIEEHMAILQEVINDQTQRRDENTKLLESRKQECQEEVNDYGESRGKQLEQINIVEKIITLTETNLAVMKQYLGERRQESGVKVNMKI